MYYLCSENKGADQLRGYREVDLRLCFRICNQRTNGPVNTHLISWPSKTQNIQNLENIWYINDLDLQYSHTFINFICCLHLPTFRSQAAIVSEKSTVFTSIHRNAKVTKFDLAVKMVKVTRWSSFEQTMMDWSPRSYTPRFVEIGLPVPEKMIFKGFLPYMGMAAILVM